MLNAFDGMPSCGDPLFPTTPWYVFLDKSWDSLKWFPVHFCRSASMLIVILKYCIFFQTLSHHVFSCTLHLLLSGMECAMGNRFGHVESHGSHMKCRFVPHINYFQSNDLKSWLHSTDEGWKVLDLLFFCQTGEKLHFCWLSKRPFKPELFIEPFDWFGPTRWCFVAAFDGKPSL